jgi:hypothetical protein
LLLFTDQSVVSQGLIDWLIDCSSCGSRLIVSSTSHPPMLFWWCRPCRRQSWTDNPCPVVAPVMLGIASYQRNWEIRWSGWKNQVGLLGMARTLQRDLDRIAQRADTTTEEGLHYVLTGV